MNKSRRGAALIMALVIVLVGGSIIALTFDFVYSYAWFAQEEKIAYVDHTTLVSYVQQMKGIIISENEANSETRHAEEVNDWYKSVATSPMTLDSLRLDSPYTDPADALRSWTAWHLTDDDVKSKGVGRQRVVVDVYDMFFETGWVDPAALLEKDFPPVFMMSGVNAYGGGGGAGGGTGSVGGTIEGESISVSTGTGTHGTGSPGDLDLSGYGAYLIRAKLYDREKEIPHNWKREPTRTIEEAFVQILPTP